MLYIFSYSQDEVSAIKERAGELSNLIETVIVNSDVPASFKTHTDDDDVLLDKNKYMDKIHRDKYKNEQLKFFETLKNTSVKIKNIEVEKRKPALQNKLRELNRWIIKDLRQWDVDHESDYEVKFHGSTEFFKS